jgi:uncharacterized protein YndB with AHSA1/START domain
MTQTTDTVVRRSIVVNASVEHAFTFFTRDIGKWWNPAHHLLDAPIAEMVFEPVVGGHIIDRGADGSECRWSTVLAYEPPNYVAFSWNINLAWQVETDPARCSEVHVTFTAQDDGGTLVELEHRHLERHGDGWEAMRDAVGSPDGWDLGPFAQALAEDG